MGQFLGLVRNLNGQVRELLLGMPAVRLEHHTKKRLGTGIAQINPHQPGVRVTDFLLHQLQLVLVEAQRVAHIGRGDDLGGLANAARKFRQGLVATFKVGVQHEQGCADTVSGDVVAVE